ncbi:DUF4159 domain-containing protein [Paracoccaceae bacterium GXU_MW_L88]
MIGFAAPWLLLGLFALPLLWLAMRAKPPLPREIAFPGLDLLRDAPATRAPLSQTPLWLRLLRLAIAALVIVALAGPVLRPTTPGQGRLLVLYDGGWASAPDWPDRRAFLRDSLRDAARSGRPVALVSLAEPVTGPLNFTTADEAIGRLAATRPAPWAPDPRGLAEVVAEGEDFETLWLSDGLARDGDAALAEALAARGAVSRRIMAPPLMALATDEENGLRVLRRGTAAPAEVTLMAEGDALTNWTVEGAALTPQIPPGHLARMTHFALEGARHAGAVVPLGDASRAARIVLVGPQGGERADLADPLFYLRRALAGRAVSALPIADAVESGADLIIIAGIAQIGPEDAARLNDWAADGGRLMRFATADMENDESLPAPLGEGARSFGEALSERPPQTVQAGRGVLTGLGGNAEIAVRQQVLLGAGAEVLIPLEDGTPLVSGTDTSGAGARLFVHVPPAPGWSDLPLSDLFLGMIDRLAQIRGPLAEVPEGEWVLEQMVDEQGRLRPPPRAVSAELDGPPGPERPPGLWRRGGQRAGVPLLGPDAALVAAGPLPGVTEIGAATTARPIAPLLLALAMLLLAAEALGSGRVARRFAPVLLALAALAPKAEAQTAPIPALETVLAYVETGDPAVDDLSSAGLRGLSAELARRTAVEPAAPEGVVPGRDPLALYPLLYWPVTAQVLDAGGRAAMQDYLANGGMLLIDGSEGPDLARLTSGLTLPPLAPVDSDHVLSRSYYLLPQIMGRLGPVQIWAAAGDQVSSVLIGNGDWAAAWAVDGLGAAMRPVGSGYDGAFRRELTMRFGVNLVMYALTGNYKSDQLHVQNLMDRMRR